MNRVELHVLSDSSFAPPARAAVLALLLVLSLLLLTGCPTHANYRSAQRLTDHTAYTLPPGEGLVGVGLIGTQMDDLLTCVRLEWSPDVLLSQIDPPWGRVRCRTWCPAARPAGRSL